MNCQHQSFWLDTTGGQDLAVALCQDCGKGADVRLTFGEWTDKRDLWADEPSGGPDAFEYQANP